MPTIPQIKALKTNSSVEVLNAIRNSATTNYKNYVPIATAGGENIAQIGAVIMDNPTIQNEFISMINRIALVVVTNKMYDNPLRMFKRGMLEYGETIEEVYIDLSKVFDYDPESAETTLFKREKPDVKTAFHIVNFKKFYKVTIEDETLSNAFLSSNGVIDLIMKIVNSVYKSHNYDEFIVTKYMLAYKLITGQIKAIQTNINDASDVVKSVKYISNDMTFLNTKYNRAGVHNHSDKQNQYVIVNSEFDAEMSVDVLATAFNMDKAEFSGHRVLIDGFGELDIERLNTLLGEMPGYHEFSEAEMTALNSIPAVLVDYEFIRIYDKLFTMREVPNAQGLYRNVILHAWKYFSTSVFENAVCFVSGTPAVTAVSVSPSAVTVSKGQSVQFTPNVTANNFANETVDWSVNTENVTVTNNGYVTVGSTVAKDTEITVTATSVNNPTIKGTAKITVA